MRLTALSVCIALAALFVASANPAAAAQKKGKAKPAETHATTIASVTPQSITIQEDKITKTFTITQFTEITVNGQRAAVTQLQPGMTVTVALGGDPTKVSRIDAGGVPVQPAR